MNRIFSFLRESYLELRYKMTWATWPQLQQYTIIILIFMILFSLLVWVMDLASSNGMDLIYSIFR